MSVTFPTLDLGDLGTAFEDALQDAALDEPAPDAAPVVDGESAVVPVAAAEAAPVEATDDEKPALDAAYEARFEADYRERSKADFGKLRSGLDRQIGELRDKHAVVSENHDEALAYASFLEEKLAEYDPDEVRRYRANREAHNTTRERQRGMKQMDLENRRALRDREFRKLYPDLDPEEPSLVEAFVSGDYRLEAARIAAQLAQAQLGKAQRTPAAPAKAPAPVTPATAAKAPTERDGQGRFLSRAEQTRQTEAARGAESVAAGRGGGFPEQAPTDLLSARKVFASKMAALVGRA